MVYSTEPMYIANAALISVHASCIERLLPHFQSYGMHLTSHQSARYRHPILKYCSLPILLCNGITKNQALLTKYESLRAAGKIANTIENSSDIQHTAHLSDEELYRELQHELLSGLGITESSRGHAAQPPAPPPTPGSTALVEHRRHSNRASAAGAAAAASSTEASASERQEKDPPLPEARVLVVDDSHISCKLAVRALSQQNFHCEVSMLVDQVFGSRVWDGIFVTSGSRAPSQFSSASPTWTAPPTDGVDFRL